MDDPKGTIVFTTVGRPYYGFDIFSVKLPSNLDNNNYSISENRLTDGISVNFNGNFVDEDQTLVYVTERTGASRIYLNRPRPHFDPDPAGTGLIIPKSEEQLLLLLPYPPETLFQDRPVIKHGRLYFVSAHEQPAAAATATATATAAAHQDQDEDQPSSSSSLIKSWCALYSSSSFSSSAGLIGLLHHDHMISTSATTTTTSKNKNKNNINIVRLTPYGCVDYSPSISQSGKFVAVASYGSRPWSTAQFHDLQTDIVVFPSSDPTKRTVVCQHGGWPTWSGDTTIYFHRQVDDGWWSIFRVDFDFDLQLSSKAGHSPPPPPPPRRVTPPGLHSFTPAAMHNRRNQIAVATRRRDNNFRHIEVFDVESQKFYPVTKSLNPNFHHYNPFVSPESGFLGYHRFRGRGSGDEVDQSIIPHLQPVTSPIKTLRMLRLNGSFPSFSPKGDLIAFNHDFDSNSGLKVVKSDGSKRWTLFKDRTAFYNSWSPVEKNVIYTSIGPIFQSVTATVQIARISFDPPATATATAHHDHELVEEEEEQQHHHHIPLLHDHDVKIKILTREDTGNNAFPSCSPDGNSVVFRSGRSGYKNLYIVDAVHGEFNGGGIRQLTEGPWIDTMPSWSPQGNLIAFSSNRHNLPDNVDAFSIYLIRPDGTDLRRVHVAGSDDRERINHVCFSADGEWLLFAANLGGVTAEPVSLPNQFQPYGDLFVVRLDGSGLRRLTWNGYENGTPAWHPSAELDIGRLSLDCKVGDKLRGQFDDPLWIHCDF